MVDVCMDQNFLLRQDRYKDIYIKVSLLEYLLACNKLTYFGLFSAVVDDNVTNVSLDEEDGFGCLYDLYILKVELED